MTDPASLITRLRETFPQNPEFGPVTAYQRAMIHEAADALQYLSARLEVVPGFSESADGISCRDETIRLQVERIERLTTRLEVAERALGEIRSLEPRPYDGKKFDREASDACPECQGYRGHPIQQGICSTHRQPFYQRERHEAHEEKILGYRCKSIAADALAYHNTEATETGNGDT